MTPVPAEGRTGEEDDRHAPGCPARGTTGFPWACSAVDCAPTAPVPPRRDDPEISDELEVEGYAGVRAQVMHGARCVGLVIFDPRTPAAGIVFTPDAARRLAAALTRQADHSEEPS